VSPVYVGVQPLLWAEDLGPTYQRESLPQKLKSKLALRGKAPVMDRSLKLDAYWKKLKGCDPIRLQADASYHFEPSGIYLFPIA